jgi:hypothetical protein
MRHLAGWIVVRTILVADVALLIVSGFICLVWVAAPGGILVAAALWMIAGGLLGLLPYTDPYRDEQRQQRRRAQARREQAQGTVTRPPTDPRARAAWPPPPIAREPGPRPLP